MTEDCLKIVLPGDSVPLSSPTIGPGLHVTEEDPSFATVCASGLLRGQGESAKKLWVDYSAKRYVPVRGDRVVGVVKATGRSHRIDIGSAVPAVLPELSFEGATKRNKPALQVGELVYARVCRAHKDVEAELSCVDGTSGKANGLGPLPVEGYLIRCSVGLARKLLTPSSPILEALGQFFKFEVTVGMNGKVWIHSSSTSHTIAIANAIKSSEYASPSECKEIAKVLSQTVR